MRNPFPRMMADFAATIVQVGRSTYVGESLNDGDEGRYVGIGWVDRVGTGLEV